MTRFIALDVETANEDLSSICQVGYAVFENGQVIRTFGQYVDPEDHFSSINIDIHGITPQMTRGMPNFPAILAQIAPEITDHFIVHHTFFDRVAFNRAAGKYQVALPPSTWIDSSCVVRRVWEKYRKSGFGLANLAQEFRIPFENHHDAVADAIMAGLIMCRALQESATTPDQWQQVIKSRPSFPQNVRMLGDGDGPLLGDTVVFTGQLSIPRIKAAELASTAGADVWDHVTKKTTILVVGDQDIRLLAGHMKSTKHRYAEELISQGAAIRILTESDFMEAIKEC